MGRTVELSNRGTQVNEKTDFRLVGAAALALAACGSGNQDQVDNAVINQPSADQLNELANEAANDAAKPRRKQQVSASRG